MATDDGFTEADYEQAGLYARAEMDVEIEGAAFSALFDLLRVVIGDSAGLEEDEQAEIVFELASGRLWETCWERGLQRVSDDKKAGGDNAPTGPESV